MTSEQPPYRSLSSRLKERFDEPVRKITIDAGLGCPNRDGAVGSGGCIYCNPRGSGTGGSVAGLGIEAQIDRGIRFLSQRFKCRKFIAYFQSFTNTYAPPDRLRELYAQAVERPEVVGLAIGTRPDCVPDPVLDVIESFAVEKETWVEYGLQSIHDRSLQLINRGHGADAFFDAVKRSQSRNISVVVHLILGLPGESVADMIETARAVGDAGVQGVKLHPLYVIRGTELERMMREGQYTPIREEEALDATLAVLEALPAQTVIHRLTSDPHPEELAAPRWMLDRRHVRRNLDTALRQRDIKRESRL